MRRLPKYIVRFDYGRTHGYWVRVDRMTFKAQKLFSDKAYAGKRKALDAATKYRDSLLKFIPPRAHRYAEPGPGYVKKERRYYFNALGERKHFDAWTAWIRVDEHRVASSNYSIAKWGTRAAKSKALSYLEAKQKEQKKNYARLRKQKAAERARASGQDVRKPVRVNRDHSRRKVGNQRRPVLHS